MLYDKRMPSLREKILGQALAEDARIEAQARGISRDSVTKKINKKKK